MKKQQRRFLKPKWIVALVVLLIIAVAIFLLSRPQAVHYQTYQVSYHDLSQKVLATGQLDSVRKVDVGAQVSGQLKKLSVSIGDKVEKDQLLALIDPEPAESQIKELQADLENFNAQLAQAQAQYNLSLETLKRNRQLIKSNVISPQDFDSLKADTEVKKAHIDSIKAQINKTSAQLEMAKTNLNYTRIIAPISGTVTDITTLEGQTVIAAQQAPTIMTLADLDTMLVKAQVSEADVIHLKPGLKVSFTVLGDSHTKYEAHLKDIQPTPVLINNAIFYNARFEVPNPDGILRLQMTAQVHILLNEYKHILTIPLSALGQRLDNDHFEVMVLKNGKPETVSVETGQRNDTDIQIMSGLEEGDAVILSSSPQSN